MQKKTNLVRPMRMDLDPNNWDIFWADSGMTPEFLGSLANNQLCGLDHRGRGTYTTEGITKLCEGLKGSAVTSLGCAAAPKRVRIYG